MSLTKVVHSVPFQVSMVAVFAIGVVINALYQSWIMVAFMLSGMLHSWCRALDRRPSMLHMTLGQIHAAFRAGSVKPLTGFLRALDRASDVCFLAAIGMCLYRLAA